MSYDIALRYDDLGLDDVVVKNVSMFRMERMDDDYVWLACYLVFDLEIHADGHIAYTAREPLPHVKYERGESNAGKRSVDTDKEGGP